ncbi:MAG: SufE family protein [Alphaproteobacteria bacterium]
MADALTTDELIENFGLFDDWQDRYRYLMDLGRALPELPEADKVDGNIVKGCLSQVWLVPEVEALAEDRVDFRADSDSAIVRGLIAVLKVVYGNQSRADVGQIDIEDIFSQLGLSEHLSPNRRNGFFAMVGKIQQLGTGAEA